MLRVLSAVTLLSTFEKATSVSAIPPQGQPSHPHVPQGKLVQPPIAPPVANPYAPPQADLGPPSPWNSSQAWKTGPEAGGEVFAPCPGCGCTYADRVAFTWWGGLIGPKMFTHVRCRNCAACYNGKRGTWNSTNIVIYTVVGLIAGLGLMLFWMNVN
jgi:hypothetical protein